MYLSLKIEKKYFACSVAKHIYNMNVLGHTKYYILDIEIITNLNVKTKKCSFSDDVYRNFQECREFLGILKEFWI